MPLQTNANVALCFDGLGCHKFVWRKWSLVTHKHLTLPRLSMTCRLTFWLLLRSAIALEPGSLEREMPFVKILGGRKHYLDIPLIIVFFYEGSVSHETLALDNFMQIMVSSMDLPRCQCGELKLACMITIPMWFSTTFFWRFRIVTLWYEAVVLYFLMNIFAVAGGFNLKAGRGMSLRRCLTQLPIHFPWNPWVFIVYFTYCPMFAVVCNFYYISHVTFRRSCLIVYALPQRLPKIASLRLVSYNILLTRTPSCVLYILSFREFFITRKCIFYFHLSPSVCSLPSHTQKINRIRDVHVDFV